MRLILAVFILGIWSCASVQQVGKKVEYDFEKPNIRIDKYPETFLLKGKGSVLCGQNPCSETEIAALTPDKIKNLVKHGVWEEYAQKEKIATKEAPDTKEKYSVLDKKGEYVNGKKEGIWKNFYEDGALLRESNYKGGVKNGVEKKYKQSGEVLEEANYKEDLLEGPYFKKNRDALMEAEGQYSKDKKTGQWKEYYAEKQDGILKAVLNYKEDKKNGNAVRYYPDGKTKLSEGNFIDNLENGPWKNYHDNGNLESEGSFKPVEAPVADEGDKDKQADVKPKAKKTGLWKRYYKSSELFSEGNRDGKPIGEWKFYHKNGKIAAKGTMSNDVMMSEGEFFDEDGLLSGKGKLLISIFSIDAKTDGLQKSFRPSKPFTVYKKGKKYLEITKIEKEGAATAYLYDDSEKKIGEGPIEPNTQKKNGCWTISGKKSYYIMDNLKTGVMAQMQKCE